MDTPPRRTLCRPHQWKLTRRLQHLPSTSPRPPNPARSRPPQHSTAARARPPKTRARPCPPTKRTQTTVSPPQHPRARRPSDQRRASTGAAAHIPRVAALARQLGGVLSDAPARETPRSLAGLAEWLRGEREASAALLERISSGAYAHLGLVLPRPPGAGASGREA